MCLLTISVMEQRYQAVMAVIQDGWKVVEVVERLGVARQSLHNWTRGYEPGGLQFGPQPADSFWMPSSFDCNSRPRASFMGSNG